MVSLYYILQKISNNNYCKKDGGGGYILWQFNFIVRCRVGDETTTTSLEGWADPAHHINTVQVDGPWSPAADLIPCIVSLPVDNKHTLHYPYTPRRPGPNIGTVT